MIESILGIILFVLAVHGVYLSFKANIILGIVMLFILPIAAIFSLAFLILKMNIPEIIVGAFAGKSS